MKSLLQQILEDCEYTCRSYSGRSMYGKECLAIITKDSPYTVGLRIGLNAGLDADELSEEEPSIDYMGKNDVVIYWKGVEYYEEEED